MVHQIERVVEEDKGPVEVVRDQWEGVHGVEEVLAQAEEALHVEEVAEAIVASPWLARISRFGYLAKGAIYATIGLLTLQTALGVRRVAPDTKDALYTIVTQPFGELLLAAVAVGLVGYMVWRFVEALLDVEAKGHNVMGIAQRVGYFLSGLLYGGLALAAIEIITGNGGAPGTVSTEDWTQAFFLYPLGTWVVAAAGAGTVGYGIEQLYEAYSAKFRELFQESTMGQRAIRWAVYCGRLGYAARGIVYTLIGLFLIRAAFLVDAAQAHGLREVLTRLAQQSNGPWVLGGVGLGLLAYGLYAMFEARYRAIASGRTKVSGNESVRYQVFGSAKK